MQHYLPEAPKVVSLYAGRLLDDYTKDELIEIIIEMGQLAEQNHQEHMRELSVLAGLDKPHH